MGDTHGRSLWKLIVHQEQDADRIIFVGDYFDSFDISGVEQIHNFKEIIEYKKTSGKEVVLLVGNHDYHYFPEIGYTGTSGYQTVLAPSISQVVDENREHLQMAYKFDNILCTHAGVTKTFMNSVYGEEGWSIDSVDSELNELFKYKPKSFKFTLNYGTKLANPYGDDIWQSPIWVRPRSLQKDGVDKKKYIQVVGHSTQNQIDIKGKSTGGRYYYIDTLGTSGEYIVVKDNIISNGSTR